MYNQVGGVRGQYKLIHQSLLQVLSSEEMSKLDGEAAAQKEVAEERKKELRSLQNGESSEYLHTSD